MQRQEPLEGRHGREAYALGLDARERHLKLLTDTIEAVNSTLDLEEVLSQVATKVADALRADACFVYLYDERSAELVLRATHGTRVEEMTQRPRMRPGEGITGSAAEERAPVMIAARGEPRPALQELPEPARGRVRVDPRRADPRPRGERLEGALNIRTRVARGTSPRTRSSCCSRSRPRSRSRSSTRSSTRRRSAACTSSRRWRGSPRRFRRPSTSRSRSRRS